MTHSAPTNPFADRQGPPRKESVGGSVTIDEKQTILTALSNGGFESASEGVRAVCLAYAESAAVRAAVAAAVKQHSIS